VDGAADDAVQAPPTPGTGADRPLAELVLAAASAAIPPGLLARLRLAAAGHARARATGRAGHPQSGGSRGRPAGLRRGRPQAGARLDLVATLRAAAPWQRLRGSAGAAGGPQARIQVRRDDFQITRFRQRARATAIFVVDASGSAALHRLAEAKGAIELLLAECYVRRDQAALIAFRGQAAELLLPPTRALARARRQLAGLPGGGGTPLAAGLDAALALAAGLRRRGGAPGVILLTDGRANIARDGRPGRVRAAEDALAAARLLAAEGLASLVIDLAPQPQPAAAALARAMRAGYLPLPHANAATLARAVRAAQARPAVRP
jgi:magnesium chelatase subunit D